MEMKYTEADLKKAETKGWEDRKKFERATGSISNLYYEGLRALTCSGKELLERKLVALEDDWNTVETLMKDNDKDYVSDFSKPHYMACKYTLSNGIKVREEKR